MGKQRCFVEHYPFGVVRYRRSRSEDGKLIEDIVGTREKIRWLKSQKKFDERNYFCRFQ